MEKHRDLIQSYIDGWKNLDAEQILRPLSDDCQIIESHGPTYRGKESIRQWIADWHQQGNTIEKWVVKTFHECGDILVCEWDFAYKGKIIKEAFAGITLAHVKQGKISDLKEYRMTAAPFKWHPTKN